MTSFGAVVKDLLLWIEIMSFDYFQYDFWVNRIFLGIMKSLETWNLYAREVTEEWLKNCWGIVIELNFVSSVSAKSIAFCNVAFPTFANARKIFGEFNNFGWEIYRCFNKSCKQKSSNGQEYFFITTPEEIRSHVKRSMLAFTLVYERVYAFYFSLRRIL